MCGIAGIYKREGNVTLDGLKAMCDKLAQRGPDNEGFYLNNKIGLGHRRLSIIDLNTGDQPMYSSDKSIVVVFNGEIYNFKELRERLTQEGYIFNSNSDTEVLINGYLFYGLEKLLTEIEGMFAFALYDAARKLLFIARDKFGEKPLYYSDSDSALTFASELKAFPEGTLKDEIDIDALNYFLSLTYIPAPYTIYKNIRKLEPGTYLIVDDTGKVILDTYFDLASFLKGSSAIEDFIMAKEIVKESVTRSTTNRMISDVPLGVFLSGGIDSSIVATIMNILGDEPINTFTIGFYEKLYNESNRADTISRYLKSNHTIQFLDYKDVVTLIDEIILYYDEPFGDSSAIPTFFLARLARQKVKVVLTGDCADELFGGYEKYLGHFYAHKFRNLPTSLQNFLKKLVNSIPHNRITNLYLRKIKKVINNSSLSDFDLYYNLMSLGYNDNERSKLLNPDWYADIKQRIFKIFNSYPGDNTLEKSQFTDIKIVLEGDMFVKTDRVCMKNSLESRAPFIDTQIVEAVFRMPEEFKIKTKNKKVVLKEAFKEMLPKKTLSYRKKGFGVPVDYWLRNELKSELQRLIDPKLIESQGIFNYEYIKTLFDEHQSGKENHKSKLWNLYVFQKWYFVNKTR